MEAGKKKVEHEISEGNVATAAAAALASAATKAKVCSAHRSTAWFAVHIRSLFKMVFRSRAVELHVVISNTLKGHRCHL